MKLYRFSPIKTQQELLEAVAYVHFACHKLCKQTFGDYLPVAGNVGIFCHYDDEFDRLVSMRDALADVNDNWHQKYYRLHEPITIPAKGEVPAATYTYLYIRKADPYRAQVGDVDFALQPEKFIPFKQSILGNVQVKGARAFNRPDLDMIELCDPDIDALAYVHTHTMADNVRAQRNKK